MLNLLAMLSLLLPVQPAHAAGPAPAAGLCAGATTQTVTLVHVTDLHARYQPGPDGISPYARLRGYFDSVLAENPQALFLDGGDDHEKGSLADLLSSGTATNDVVRAMRFDVRVLGNHDFAWGEAAVRDYLRDPHAAVLGGNLTPVRVSTGPAPAFFVVRQVGCVRVGFFGFAPLPWNERNEPYAGDYPGFRADHDHAGAARRALQAAAGQADIVVMLSHLGNNYDLDLAGKVGGIDLVLGGHTHGLTWTPKKAGGALVAESGPYAEFVTRADIVYDLGVRRVVRIGHRLRRVDASMKPDPAVESAVEGILKRSAPDAGRPLSCALRDATPLSAAAAAAGALVALGAADAAVVDRKDVWRPWKAGPLSAQDLLDAFAVERQPPGSTGFSAFYAVSVSGAVLSGIAARADRGRWAYAGPKAPEKGRQYLLALPMHTASRPSELVPGGFKASQPRYLMEIWEALDRGSRGRGAAGDCLDAD